MHRHGKKSIIFFDVDGTLVVGGPREYIPDSAVRAIRSAREKGHLCYLCTGRSAAELYPFILDVGFDGVIGAGRELCPDRGSRCSTTM